MVVAVALAAAVAAGCGDDGHTDLGTVSLAPSRPGYVSNADAVCAIYQDRIERNGRRRLGLHGSDFRVADSGEVVFKPGRRPPDAEIVGFVSEVAVPELEAQLSELRLLTRPAGEEQILNSIYDAAARATGTLAADPSIALDEQQMHSLFTPPLRSARSYGFRICGSRPPTVPAASG